MINRIGSLPFLAAALLSGCVNASVKPVTQEAQAEIFELEPAEQFASQIELDAVREAEDINSGRFRPYSSGDSSEDL